MQLPFKLYPQQPIAGDKLIVTYNNGILLDGLEKEIYLKFGFGEEFAEGKVYETKMIKKKWRIYSSTSSAQKWYFVCSIQR
ncbi:hypothetical protein [Caldicellulosiruptor acetigenus]|uniref:hypothetical protein n=1 Tax=Caldicellulosiruptor acetigenus TaxID=301953 RepID=UPI000426F4FD|nr:hypothetical protein [Caldicellulosiruptor acetigenus]WAM37333.1 hypothetical protein OTK01_001170 [Caldicellulosiruptor acetigenus]